MRTILSSILLLTALGSHAQDPTMSQFFNAPQLVNPAAIGFIPGKESLRLTGFVRSQWAPLSTEAYNAAGVVADFRHCLRNGHSWAVGVLIQQDGARLGTWSNVRLHAAGSYNIALNRTLHLTAGFQAGMLQLSLNTSRLMFDNQFTAAGYNSGSATGENFGGLTSRALDVHSGLLLYQTERQWVVGLALHHINQPKYSFFTQPDGRPDNTLDIGFTLHGSFSLSALGQTRLNQHWKGHVLLRKQSATIHGGAIADRKSQQWQCLAGVETRQWSGFSVGNYLRLAGRTPTLILLDSYVFQLQWKMPHGQVGLSYDVNLSRIGASNRHNGSLECTFSARFKEYTRCVLCPGM